MAQVRCVSCLSSRILFASSFSPTSLLSSSVHAGLLILGSPVRNHDACLAGCVILCSSRAFWLAHVWYGSCLLACLCVSVLGRSSLVTVLSLACCLSNRAPCSLHGWLSNQAPCSLADFLIKRRAHWLAFESSAVLIAWLSDQAPCSLPDFLIERRAHWLAI
jgi:hypothetical protein